MQYFLKKLFCQKPMIRQIEFGVQNGPIANSGFLPVATFFHTFLDRWSVI